LRHNIIQLRNFGGLTEITAPFDTAATIAALMSAASRAAAEVSLMTAVCRPATP
jgi:hypothetical protein